MRLSIVLIFWISAFVSHAQSGYKIDFKVKEWKDKADLVKQKTDKLISGIWQLKEELVYGSGGVKVGVKIAYRKVESGDFRH